MVRNSRAFLGFYGVFASKHQNLKSPIGDDPIRKMYFLKHSKISFCSTELLVTVSIAYCEHFSDLYRVSNRGLKMLLLFAFYYMLICGNNSVFQTTIVSAVALLRHKRRWWTQWRIFGAWSTRLRPILW